MSASTVFAVMKVTIEILVRPSNSAERLQDLHDAAKREAADILLRKLDPDLRVVGDIEFSHAIIKDRK